MSQSLVDRIQRSFPIFFLLFLAVSAHATEIQLEDETLSGKILGKEGGEIFFETSAGIINIRKSDIFSIDGKPYAYAPPKPAAPPAPAAGVVTEPAPAEDPAASNAVAWENRLVHPEGITEKELRDYYDAHREEFREPLKVHVRSLGQAFFTRGVGEIRSDPTSEGAWRDGGWIEFGKTVEPFEESTLRPLFDMTAGGVSQLLKDKDGVAYLLWVIERKESAIPSYKEARPKVLNRILSSR